MRLPRIAQLQHGTNTMSVSTRLRFEIFKRDRFTCQYCGRNPPAVVLHVDHIEAVSTGGSDKADNLVTACQDCNLGKSNVPLSQVPKSLKDVAKESAEKRKQLEAYHAMIEDDRQAQDVVIRQLGLHWYNLHNNEIDNYIFGDSRALTIRTFLQSLTKFQVFDAMSLAQSKVPTTFGEDDRAFRYFCGICWKIIRKIEGVQQ